MPTAVRDDPVLYGECLGGALYWNDFLALARAAGFADPRLVEDRPLAATDPALAAKLGDVRFFSATWRLFREAAWRRSLAPRLTLRPSRARHGLLTCCSMP